MDNNRYKIHGTKKNTKQPECTIQNSKIKQCKSKAMPGGNPASGPG